MFSHQLEGILRQNYYTMQRLRAVETQQRMLCNWISPNLQMPLGPMMSMPNSYEGSTTPIWESSATPTSEYSASGPTPTRESSATPTSETDSVSTGVSPILLSKENHPLPPINKEKLIDPEEVTDKYPYFLKRSKLPRLAVKLARESYFGEDIMARCNVRGLGDCYALPLPVLGELTKFISNLAYPRFVDTRASFEVLWKSCIISIGQACKTL